MLTGGAAAKVTQEKLFFFNCGTILSPAGKCMVLFFIFNFFSWTENCANFLNFSQIGIRILMKNNYFIKPFRNSNFASKIVIAI